jgi:hypothetical protein
VLVCFLLGKAIMAMVEMEARRQGDRYVVTDEEIAKYRQDGYVHLKVFSRFLVELHAGCLSIRRRPSVIVLVLRYVGAIVSIFYHVVWLGVEFSGIRVFGLCCVVFLGSGSR